MYTNITYNDGFGAQYIRIIQTYIYCKYRNIKFLYTPITKIEHNYYNNVNYIANIENMINLENNITNDIACIAKPIKYKLIRSWSDDNMDFCCKSKDMEFIKKCFWENKDRNVFNNECINIAVHIRRDNSHDIGLAGERTTTTNDYFLRVMNSIRNKYDKKQNLQFHIYSQGDKGNFKIIDNEDVLFHLDEDICKTFIGLVGADILVLSPSMLSYVAALISDGEIYYKKFWHNPCSYWNQIH